MKKPKLRVFHNPSGFKLSVTYGADALVVAISCPWSPSQRVSVEVIAVSLNPYGLPEQERTLAQKEIDLSMVEELNQKHLVGSYVLPGTFDKDWSERLYFRIHEEL